MLAFEPALGSGLPVEVMERHPVGPAEGAAQCLQIHLHEHLTPRPVQLVTGALEI